MLSSLGLRFLPIILLSDRHIYMPSTSTIFQCLSVCFVNILAKQIDHQNYLLEREAKRVERRRKRDGKDRSRQRPSLDQLEEGKLTSFDPVRLFINRQYVDLFVAHWCGGRFTRSITGYCGYVALHTANSENEKKEDYEWIFCGS